MSDERQKFTLRHWVEAWGLDCPVQFLDLHVNDIVVGVQTYRLANGYLTIEPIMLGHRETELRARSNG